MDDGKHRFVRAEPVVKAEQQVSDACGVAEREHVLNQSVDLVYRRCFSAGHFGANLRDCGLIGLHYSSPAGTPVPPSILVMAHLLRSSYSYFIS